MKINRLTPRNHKYLSPLGVIPTPPKILFFRGQIPAERCISVAIVGTRKPTAYGKEVTHTLATELAKKGIVIISGLALGVDAIAHRAALEAKGTTIAILANSVDRIYPRTNHALGEQIIANGGAIMSEYEPPTDARDFQFLQRNRIVSGLADAVIITEAAKRSGTLATATHALEQAKKCLSCPATSPARSQPAATHY